MAKLSTRILSLVLTLLMVVSMVAVFTLPALAAEEEIDYEAYFEGAYLINKGWKDEELVDDRVIFFEYRGKRREVICDTSKHFNNWADAEASAYSEVTSNNIYSYTPVFIFSAGTYSETIHFPTNAVILGANAGISPNAPVEDGEWTAEKIGENSGWTKNPERDPANETVFTTAIIMATRVGDNYQQHAATGAPEERFAYWLEQAKQSGKDPQLTYIIDGVTMRGGLNIHHFDYGQNLMYPVGGTVIKNTSRRKIDGYYRNVIYSSTSAMAYSNNGAQNIVSVHMSDCDISAVNTGLVQRDIKFAEFKNVYFHDFASGGSLWNKSNLVNWNLFSTNGGSTSYADGYGYEVESLVEDCVFYNMASTNVNALMVGAYLRTDQTPSVKNVSTSFTHTFDNNIFYDAACGQDDYIINAFDLDKTSNVTINITNNQFHQSEGKRVYSPFDLVADHIKSDDKVVYENNTITGDILKSEYAEPIDFNNMLKYGITAKGITFTSKDTAVFAPAGITTMTQLGRETFVATFAGKKYKFTIDNSTVFANASNFNMAKAKFAGKNIILLAGDYGDIDITFPATIYGADFGENPNDTTKATAENNYNWELNSNFGLYGKTVVGSINITDEIEGNLTIDGIVQAGSLNDTARKSAETGALNITVKNVLLDDSAIVTETAEISNWYNLGNDRSRSGSKGLLVDKEFGKTYADSFTLENAHVVSSTTHSALMDEYVPAITTVNGLYVDGQTSGKTSSLLSKFKLGVNNLNGNVTVKNSNIRNGQSTDHVVYVESYSDKLTGSVAQITDQKFAVTVEKNIFYNATSGTGSVVRVRTGLVSALDVNANIFINDNEATGKVINAMVTHKNTEEAINALPLNGNISISCNSLTGYADDQLIGNFKMGDGYPAATEHTFGDAVANGDATCKDMGTATKTCAKCGATEKVAGTAYGDHKWDAGVYNNDATTEKDGTKTYTCTICKETDVKTAPGTKLPESTTPGGNEPGGNESGGNESGGNESGGNESGGNQPEPDENPVEIIDSTKKFTDVKAKKWYTAAIDHAASYGLVSGITETTFGLNVEINRGMFITILARVAGVDTSSKANKAATTKFTDVKAGKYYAAAIAWANTNGIVSGKTDTTFEPETAITRQELAVMIVNFAKQQKIELKSTEKAAAFADSASISNWAKSAVETCQTAGIINGYNEGGKLYIKPKATATRAEATQMLYKFHKDFFLKK